VLLGQDGTDQADQGVAVGEDPDNVGPAPNFSVQALVECLADEEARARRRERDRARRAEQDLELRARTAEAIRRIFPGCPAGRAEAIACHATVRGSGRVGRTAAGRAMEPEAITLAVIASVRHHDTAYDELLMAGVERNEAR
jgi:hypothetical protein